MVANKAPSLELIQIASPCTASWEAMRGDDRVRHCSSCNLNVFNVSDMTREEAIAFVANREGRTCIRMFKRPDGTVITRDCPVGLAALRAKFVRLVLATAAMFLTLIGAAFAAVIKTPGMRAYLSQGKVDCLYNLNSQYVVMGDFCPPPAPILPNPTAAPAAGQAVLGHLEEPQQ